MQLSHMIPGVNIIGRKVSVANVNVAEGPGVSLRPQWGPKENFQALKSI